MEDWQKNIHNCPSSSSIAPPNNNEPLSNKVLMPVGNYHSFHHMNTLDHHCSRHGRYAIGADHDMEMWSAR